jgi:hypothetical protein
VICVRLLPGVDHCGEPFFALLLLLCASVKSSVHLIGAEACVVGILVILIYSFY